MNRPILAEDMPAVALHPRALAIRKLVRDYQAQSLPVLNSSFAHSNLREGPSQILTCNPCPLWEYSSLFDSLPDQHAKRFVEHKSPPQKGELL